MPGQAAPAQQQGVIVDHPVIQDPEALFAALDGRELAVLGKRWRVEVFSVCELGGRRYVQIALQGDTQYMLTLRIAPKAELRDLIPCLLTWVQHPSSTGEILDVPSQN